MQKSTSAKSRKFSRYIFIVVGIFFLLFWFGVFVYQRILQNEIKKAVFLDGSESIDELSEVNLGGVGQWIRVRGNNRSNPMLLFLHGGPGAPLFPSIKKIGVDTGIESSFTVVYWEQRGTGKSFHFSLDPQSMTISQLISDTQELCLYLQERYLVGRIYLLGRSFGSLIGIITIQKYPELFYAYIGVGQLISPLVNDSLSYERTLEMARQQNNTAAVEELLKIGYPPYEYKQILRQRRWLTRLTAIKNSITHPVKENDYFLNLQTLLSTPEYSLLDIWRMGMQPLFSIQHLWNLEYYQIDLLKSIQRLDLPVFFLCGRQDDFTPSLLVEKFYQQLEDPQGKRLFWFEYSGHHLEYDEPAKFRQILESQILTISRME